jgi:1-acyl-sn-glycerol-3-phosphate acyltransferase
MTFWMIPMVLVAIIKFLLPFNPVSRLCTPALQFFYRCAAWGNSLWMRHVVGVEIIVQGQLPQTPTLIVVCNHQSWFDIPILHHVITGQGPIVKFLIKRQLIWVPVIGWMCWAFNFPRLRRGQGSGSKKQDFAAIESASASMVHEPGALLIFAEGTRFTEEKRLRQKSPYTQLLKPKPGGLKIAMQNIEPDTPVVDLTIFYEGGDTNFWRCLHRSTKTIRVVITPHVAAEITDPRVWLEDRWQEKEAGLITEGRHQPG